MKYQPGQSGNPRGRPRGAISKRTQLAKLFEPHAEELIERAVQLAKDGDMNALRLCLERILPKPRDETIELDIPEVSLTTSEDLLLFANQILNKVLAGDLSPEQAQKLFSMVNTHQDIIKMTEIESRLKDVERLLKSRVTKQQRGKQ